MAHQTPITAWLSERRQKLNLSITEFRWGKSFLEPFYDMEVKVTVGGKTCEGRGTSRTELTALEKACAEAIERLVCQHNTLSTEGVAVHPIQMAANENARFEALERFLFTWHREKAITFEFVNNHFTREFSQEFESNNPDAKIEFRLMKSPMSTFSPICKITNGDHSFIGLSCGNEARNVFEKAYFEALRNFYAQKLNPVSYANALKENSDLWCGNSEFIQKLDPLFGNELSQEKIPFFDITSERLPMKSVTGLEDCPFHAERASVLRGKP